MSILVRLLTNLMFFFWFSQPKFPIMQYMVSITCAVRALVFGFYRNVFSFRIKVSLKTLKFIFVHFVSQVNKRFLFGWFLWFRFSQLFFWIFLVFYSFLHIPCLSSFGQKFITRFLLIWRNFILWHMSTKCIIHMLSHCFCNRLEVCHLTSSALDFL